MLTFGNPPSFILRMFRGHRIPAALACFIVDEAGSKQLLVWGRIAVAVLQRRSTLRRIFRASPVSATFGNFSTAIQFPAVPGGLVSRHTLTV